MGNPFSCLSPKTKGKSRAADADCRKRRQRSREGANVGAAAADADAGNVASVSVDAASAMRRDRTEDVAWALEDVEDEEKKAGPLIVPGGSDDDSDAAAVALVGSRPDTATKPKSAEPRRSIEQHEPERIGLTNGSDCIPVSMRQEHESYCKRLTKHREMTRALVKLHESPRPVSREPLPDTALPDTPTRKCQGDSGDSIHTSKNGDVCKERNTTRCLEGEAVTRYLDIGEGDEPQFDRNTCLSSISRISKVENEKCKAALNSKTRSGTARMGLGRKNEVPWKREMNKALQPTRNTFFKECSVDQDTLSSVKRSLSTQYGNTEHKHHVLNDAMFRKKSFNKDDNGVRAITRCRPKRAKLALQPLFEDTEEEEKTETEEFCLDIILTNCLAKVKFGFRPAKRKPYAEKVGDARVCHLDTIVEDEAGEERAELEHYCTYIIYQCVDLIKFDLEAGEANTNNNYLDTDRKDLSEKTRIQYSSRARCLTGICENNGRYGVVILDTRPALSWKMYVNPVSTYCMVKKDSGHASTHDKNDWNANIKKYETENKTSMCRRSSDTADIAGDYEPRVDENRTLLRNHTHARKTNTTINYNNNYETRNRDKELSGKITNCWSDVDRRDIIRSNVRHLSDNPKTLKTSNINMETVTGERSTEKRPGTIPYTNKNERIYDKQPPQPTSRRRRNLKSNKKFTPVEAASNRQDEIVRGPDRGIVWPQRMEDVYSAGDRAYYVEQFRRTELFRQRLRKKQHSQPRWSKGLSQFQTWVVEYWGTKEMENILRPKIKICQHHANARVVCRRDTPAPTKQRQRDDG